MANPRIWLEGGPYTVRGRSWSTEPLPGYTEYVRADIANLNDARPIATAPMDADKFEPVLLWLKEYRTPEIAGWLDGQWVTPDDYFPIAGTPYAWQPLPDRPNKELNDE